MLRKRTAFTLIELLIVVAILAVLAAIAVPNFLEAQTRAKVSRAKGELRTAVQGLESYRVDNNHYPPTPLVDNSFNQGVLLVLPNLLSTPVAYLASANLLDPFLNELPDYFGVEKTGMVALYGPTPGGDWFDPGADPVAGKRYYYQSHRDYRRVAYTPDSIAALDARTVSGEWTMASFGPNKVRDLVLISNGPHWTNVHIPYDPTNGTVSAGDIARSQKEAEVTGKP